jgi:hypothetical protein
MTLPLRQSSPVDVLIGPFTDKTDGVTAETGESPSVKLSKNGQTMAAKNDATTPTSDADGYYNCELDATDTNTIGSLRLTVAASANAGPVFHDYVVLAAVVYDALYGDTPTLLTSQDIGQIYESTVATVNTQLSFDMNTTIVSDDDWIGLTVTIEDVTTGEISVRWVADVDQANDRIIINAVAPFTVAVNDILRVESRVHPTYALTAYDPPTRGEATSDRDVITSAIATAQADLDIITGTNGAELSTAAITDIWQTVLTEGYATVNTAGTASQILYTIQQFLTDSDISGTTMTIRQVNGTSAAYTITLDNATTPTDKNRVT